MHRHQSPEHCQAGSSQRRTGGGAEGGLLEDLVGGSTALVSKAGVGDVVPNEHSEELEDQRAHWHQVVEKRQSELSSAHHMHQCLNPHHFQHERCYGQVQVLHRTYSVAAILQLAEQ